MQTYGKRNPKNHPDSIDGVTEKHAREAIQGLYDAGELAWQAFFAGIGWPEGAHYCRNIEYVRKTGAPALAKHNAKAIYWLHNRLVVTA